MPSRLRMVAARARQGNSGGEQAAGAVEPGAKDRNAGRMDHSNGLDLSRSKIHMQTTEDLASHSTQLHQTGSGVAGDNI